MPEPDTAEVARAAAPSAAGRWFGPAERPLLGWLSPTDAGAGEVGVLILPPVGYAYWSAHRTLRVIGERLAGQGHTVLRIDYDGTGDSAGEQSDGGRLEAWRASVAAGAAELRELGCRRLVVVGARLGGTLGLLEGAAIGADAVLAWAPVVSGRRYASEIRLLGVPADGGGWPDGTIVAAGCVYLPETLAALAKIGVDQLRVAPARRVLVLGGEEGVLVEHLRGLGCDVERRDVAGGERALELPSEYATVPEAVVGAIVEWVGRGERDDRPVAPRSDARFTWAGGELRETVIVLGRERLTGIVSEPARAGGGTPTTVVFLNSGSEPHIGPGRAWVEYARALAADGYRCLRVDFRGWGESPDGGFAPGRPYDAHCVDDAADIVRALRADGAGRIVLVGLCASAWVALRLVLAEPVDGVIALSPQLYWRPGDPVEATMVETRRRRTPLRRRERRGGRWGLWTALDALGARPWAGRWLDGLAASRVAVTLVFAQGDDGIEYLRNRLARRLRMAERSGAVKVREIAGIDHSMARAWLRGRVVELLREELAGGDGA